jgi:hypothetical protein
MTKLSLMDAQAKREEAQKALLIGHRVQMKIAAQK